MKFKFPHWHRLHRQAENRVLNSSADKSGLPPGSLVHIGKVHDKKSKITIVQYNSEQFLLSEISSIKELPSLPNNSMVTWINIDGLYDIEVVEAIGQTFKIEALILEDILSTHQRPKMEDYINYVYLVIKGISVDAGNRFIPLYEQVSILLMDNVVVSFKEKADVTLLPIIHRLQKQNSRFRRTGSDYLTYVILDTIVDEYFVVGDCLDEVIDALEEDLLTHPSSEALQTIQLLRRELISIKRSITPLRDLLVNLRRSETELVQENTLRYFDDVYDHVLRVSDTLDSFRERVSAMQEIYLASISNKMNETMKVLTVFASIFIPLTFIAGIYGMNFEYMPELKWRWSYPLLWLFFITISLSLVVYFKKKKWL